MSLQKGIMSIISYTLFESGVRTHVHSEAVVFRQQLGRNYACIVNYSLFESGVRAHIRLLGIVFRQAGPHNIESTKCERFQV